MIYPDPVLYRHAEPVGVPSDQEDLVAGMLEAMQGARGVGLAGPQVGKIRRLFVASETGEIEDALIFINPEIEPFGKVVALEEGCLSIPGIRAEVMRPASVRVAWSALDGQRYHGEFGNLMARIIQHEFDHLEGVLFIDRLAPTDRLRIKPDLAALEEQYQPR